MFAPSAVSPVVRRVPPRRVARAALLSLLLATAASAAGPARAPAAGSLRPSATDFVELASPGDLALSSDGHWAAFTLSRAVRDTAARPSADDNDGGWKRTRQIVLLDLATRASRTLTAGDERASSPRFAPDGRSLAFLRKDALWLLPLTGGEARRLETGKLEPDDFRFSPDGRTIAFATNEEGLSVLRLLDTASGKQKPAPRLAPGVIAGLDWRSDSRELAFSLTQARSPSDVYSLDAGTGKVERWTESETGGLNAATFSEPELVRWKSFDGRTISGFLYRPAARFSGPRPVIVNIHGGPEGQSRPGFQARNNFYLEELGVALLYPNVRGSLGLGKTFVALDNGMKREDSVMDIGSLLDWIPTRPELDASRVMITGGSYGGYMTLAVATHYDARIRCSLDVVGISNFVTFLENTESYRRDLRRVEYGDERDPAMRQFLLKIAPANNAAQITRPLFVVQGRNDPRVPYTESEQMVATVKKNGGPVWYLLAADEGHGFARKRNQDFQFYATVAFVREYLLK